MLHHRTKINVNTITDTIRVIFVIYIIGIFFATNSLGFNLMLLTRSSLTHIRPVVCSKQSSSSTFLGRTRILHNHQRFLPKGEQQEHQSTEVSSFYKRQQRAALYSTSSSSSSSSSDDSIIKANSKSANNTKKSIEPTTGWLHRKPKKWQNDQSTTTEENINELLSSSSSSSAAAPSPATASKTTPTITTHLPSSSPSPPPFEETNSIWLNNSLNRQNQQTTTTTSTMPTTTPPPSPPPLNHLIISSPEFIPCNKNRRCVVTSHTITVPLSRTASSSSSPTLITIFFTITELISTPAEESFFQSLATLSPPSQRAAAYVRHASLENLDDGIIYFQGGPGFPCPPPGGGGLGLGEGGSWAGEALSRGYRRVVLMDQRGTGRSERVTKQRLELSFGWDEEEGDDGGGVEEVVEYLSHFRADEIVADAEDIRRALLLPSDDDEETAEPRPWGAALGQSYGGFCLMTYLSLVSHPPRICLLTGGIAPALTPAVEVYGSLWHRARERSLSYYERYPDDVALVKRIVRILEEGGGVRLPSGGRLTARRFLQLGLALGGSPTAFSSLHALIGEALIPGTNVFSRSFLKKMDVEQSFDDNPLYFLMHETIYGDGCDTKWAADAAYRRLLTTDPTIWDYGVTKDEDAVNPVIFFGEMVFPWMSEDYAELGGCRGRMTHLAEGLAAKRWGRLYDFDHMKMVLQTGRSVAAASVYVDDMYVDFDAVRKVTARGGPLEKCKLWITNEYQHSGLRDGGAVVFGRLLEMAKGSVRIPS